MTIGELCRSYCRVSGTDLLLGLWCGIHSRLQNGQTYKVVSFEPTLIVFGDMAYLRFKLFGGPDRLGQVILHFDDIPHMEMIHHGRIFTNQNAHPLG